jgi:hypothetical protein
MSESASHSGLELGGGQFGGGRQSGYGQVLHDYANKEDFWLAHSA